MEVSTSSSSSPAFRSWRTSLLTLRDKVQNSPSVTTDIHLLNTLISSQSQTLIAVTPNLPVYELSNLIQNLSHLISFKMTSLTWSLVLHSFGGMVKMLLGGDGIKRDLSGNAAVIEATKQCIEAVRSLVDVNQRTIMLSDNVQLLDFLLKTAFRNIMDALASKGPLVENIATDRSYTSLLHCLHLVLVNAKGSLQDHQQVSTRRMNPKVGPTDLHMCVNRTNQTIPPHSANWT